MPIMSIVNAYLLPLMMAYFHESEFHITSLQQIFPYVLTVYKILPKTLVLLKIILKLTHLTCVFKVKNFLLQILLLGFY